ncbi:DUF3306 domain-containing protein [Photobacterium leiognathi]|uniref:DUF3306 domain-containing protein n=1 Tax=Photobacterium leiognathi TaxID=553611 RepID=UPI002980F18F|nr:DUF3306 domain-containing protein [Photobacterium leiognathi]
MATNFFQRWSNRKLTKKEENETVSEELTTDDSAVVEASDALQTASVQEENAIEQTVQPQETIEDTVLTHDDADAVTYDSGVASFMKGSVEKSVKKAALRKLFHSEEFNYISDMDDCTEDYTSIQTLDPAIAAQMRGWANKALEKVTDIVENLDSDVTTNTSEIADKALENHELSPSSPTLTGSESLASPDTRQSTTLVKEADDAATLPTAASFEKNSTQDS